MAKCFQNNILVLMSCQFQSCMSELINNLLFPIHSFFFLIIVSINYTENNMFNLNQNPLFLQNIANHSNLDIKHKLLGLVHVVNIFTFFSMIFLIGVRLMMCYIPHQNTDDIAKAQKSDRTKGYQEKKETQGRPFPSVL